MAESFEELGVIKSNLAEMVKQVGIAKDRIDYLFTDQIELREDAKRCKKENKQMRKDHELLKQKVMVIEKHNSVYFDAYRYIYFYP